MTPIDTSTEAVERLLENVTPGPWVVQNMWNVGIWDDISVMHGSIMVKNDNESSSNARFIAAARDLVPALLKERDEARAKLGKFEAMTMLDFANYLTTKSIAEIKGADHE